MGRDHRSSSLVVWFWVALGSLSLLLAATPGWALTSYTDPAGYPAPWPGAITTQAYTAQGNPQYDLQGNPDGSRNATPQSSADFSSGPGNNQPSFFYYGDGSILYFRVRVSGPPTALTGSGQPFTPVIWNILLDTDGDGFKEFVIMINGDDSGAAPDDIEVIYDNAPSQRYVIGQTGIWRQDTAGPNDGANGASGNSSSWDLDSDSYVWNFGRTRVVQIDRSKNPGSQNSEYFIDLQVPLSALDATAIGGPRLGVTTPFILSATTSNSNTDPTQKDLLYAGDFALADVPIPGGDLTNGTGTIIQAPLIPTITATGTCPNITLTATVLDAFTVDPATGQTKDTISSVRFESYLDVNSDGQANDGGQWTLIGSASRTATLGQWQLNWNLNLLQNGQYLVRAVATDLQGNTTTSTNQPSLSPPSVTATVVNDCSQVPSFVQSTKTVTDLNGGQVVPGDTLLYTITVTNTGSVNALNTVVRDTLSAYLIYVPGSATPSPNATSPALVWEVGTVAPGQTRTFTFRARVTSPLPNHTVIPNTAHMTADGVSHSVSVSVTVVSLPQITLTKTVNNGEAAPGDTLVYTVTYLNEGTDTATLLVVTDSSPASTTYVPNSVTVNGVSKTDAADGDNVTVNGSTITVNIGIVPAGVSGLIRFRVVVQ